jgi:hypothetical protein
MARPFLSQCRFNQRKNPGVDREPGAETLTMEPDRELLHILQNVDLFSKSQAQVLLMH